MARPKKDPYLPLKAIVATRDISSATLYRLRRDGRIRYVVRGPGGPKPKVYYHLADVDDYLNGRVPLVVIAR